MARRFGLEHHERCANCSEGTVDGRKRCNKCAIFWCRHGQERPLVEGRLPKARIYRAGNFCGVCKCRPPIAKGRCRPCYHFFSRNGKERPLGMRLRATQAGAAA